MAGQPLGRLPHTLLRLVVCCLGLFIDMTRATSYCWYYHEDYHTLEQVYCRSGCCDDYGEEEDICCFSWTVGLIIGVCFSAVTIIIVIVFIIICCYSQKRKRQRQTGVMIGHAGPTPANTLIYTGTAYAYPHPPSAFYPGGQFPNAPPAYGPQPPAYSNLNIYQSGLPPLPTVSGSSGLSGPTAPTAPTEAVYPPAPAEYGYGNGMSKT